MLEPRVTEEDCPEGHVLIPCESPSALSASTTQSGAMCEDATAGMACVMK